MDRAPHDSNVRQENPTETAGAVSERAARTILRKLRDLDLRVRGLLVGAGIRIRLEGCQSIDAPIEEGLVYRLRLADGRRAFLELAWRAGALELSLDDREELHRERRIELYRDEEGRALAPMIRARMHPDACDRREVEHFLRRLVRAAFADTGPLPW